MVLEPVEPGEGLVFVNEVDPKVLPKRFVPFIEAGLRSAASCGPIAGYPVIGVRFILRACTYAEGPDLEATFEAAAHQAARLALEQALGVIIEPVMRVVVTVPQEHSGGVVGDLGRMRGVITHTEGLGTDLVIEADVPLAETFGYITKLRAMTKGTGTYTMEMLRYAPVPAAVQQRLAEGFGV